MVKSVGYAYPWDYAGDPAAVGRAVDLGIDAVAVSATYHSTRAATPLHPARRMIVAEHSASYIPVRAERYGRLVPAEPSWVDSGSYLTAQEQLRAARLPVHAWTVLTHNSLLGAANPDLVVRNAFGESYEYALCPAAEDVRAYCHALVGEIIELAQPDGLILEACGPLGVDHGGHHDKLEFACWTKVQRDLLSLCFCAACRELYTGAGLDPDRLATVVRDGFATAFAVDEVLGDLAEPVRTVRTGLAGRLRRELTEAAGELRVTLHGSPDPWKTGPFASVAGELPSGVDSVVLSAWGDHEVLRAELDSLWERNIRTGAYLRPDKIPAGQLLGGFDELHLYHLGLVPESALNRFAELVR
ncbi:hypothetical protein D5S17_31965 [Pseudonocardiaceae bacterium YIM PH 21723]|nr:hypothetical protein D5S17_31965 [Pseudonocardiaceae bacterium YIM PH 21723]